MTKSWLIPSLVIALVVARFILNVASVAYSLETNLIDFEENHLNIVRANLIVGVVGDNVVAFSLAYHLYNRSREGMARYYIAFLTHTLY